MSNYYLQNKERINEQAINYYYENRIKIRLKQNDYYKLYYQKNRDKLINRQPCYYLRKPKKPRSSDVKQNNESKGSKITIYTPNKIILKDSLIVSFD